MKKTKMSFLWICQMLVLSLAGTVGMMLPGVKGMFYFPMLEATGLSNAQLGWLVSFMGLLNFGAFIGGWFADRFSLKKMVAIGLLLNALSGACMAFFPSSWPIMVFAALMVGVSNSIVFWPSYIKLIRNMSSADMQGRAFGFCETGRGIFSFVINLALVAIFALFSNQVSGYKGVVLTITILNVIAVVFIAILFKDTKNEDEEETTTKGFDWEKTKAVLKMPNVWLILFVVICAYFQLHVSSYVNPYSTEIFGASVTLAALLASLQQGIRMFTGSAVGVIGDKIGNINVIVTSFVIAVISMILFALMPENPSLLMVVVVNFILISAGISALRALAFALLEETSIPMVYTGMAVGIVTTFGYISEFIVPPVAGYLLDAFPGIMGYKYIFAFGLVFAVIGLVVSIILKKKYIVKK